MKKVHLIIYIALMGVMTAVAKTPKRLLILHTNDTHSTVMPLHKNLADTSKADRGGFLRREAMVRDERANDPQLLLLDSGDFSQGSAFYSLYKGDVEVELMNRMGYDAATIGNHEFDFGLDNMARIFRLAKFPIVCANYDFSGTVAEGTVKPYIVLKRKGVKIGIFGLAPKMEGLVSPKNCVGVKYLDPGETAVKMVDVLRNKEKVDVVVCLSHLGWDTTAQNDPEMLRAASGIDLVLGGHSHTYMKQLEYAPDKTGRRVPVDQNGKHGIWVGRIEVEVK